MKHLSLLLVAAALCVAPATVSADSGDIASAFAAATPTSYEGTQTFRAEDGSWSRTYLYEFTMNHKFEVIALVIDGTRVESVSEESPLAALPYPQRGVVRDLTVSIEAWDDYSSPLPTVATGRLPQNGEGGRYAGSGFSDVDWVERGSSIWVTLNPTETVAFMPIDEIAGNTDDWSLNVYGGSASEATWFNGHWGFWVRVDPTQSFYWYNLRSPTGWSWGAIDPANVAGSYVPGSSLAVQPAGGVAIADLRTKSWMALTGVINGYMDEPSSYPKDNERSSHAAEAIALRAYGWQSVQISYAGPAAWILVQAVDQYGQLVRKSDGTVSEWTFFPSQTYGSESYIRGEVYLESGRARVIVTPTVDTALQNAYLLALSAQGGKG